MFLKTVEEAIEVCARLEAIKTYEFVFHNVFAELELLDPSHEFVTSRLKLVKKILKNLWFFHPDIVYKSAFAVMKVLFVTNLVQPASLDSPAPIFFSA